MLVYHRRDGLRELSVGVGCPGRWMLEGSMMLMATTWYIYRQVCPAPLRVPVELDTLMI